MKKIRIHEKKIMTELARSGESGMTAAELSYCCGFKKMCEVYRPLRRLQGIGYLEQTDMERISETSTKSSKKAPIFVLADLGMTALVDENWIWPSGPVPSVEDADADEWSEDELDNAPNIAEEEDTLSLENDTPLFEPTAEGKLSPLGIALGNVELRAEAAIKVLKDDPETALVHLRAILSESRTAG